MNSCATEADSTRLPSGSIATLPPVVEVIEIWVEERHAYQVALHHRDKDQQRRRPDQARDNDLFQTVENPKKH